MQEVDVVVDLIRLPKEQVSAQWPLLKELLREIIAVDMEVSPALLNNILLSLLSGELSLWVRVEEDERISIMILSSVMDDPVTRMKYFWIHGLYGDGSGNREAWLRALGTLKEAAKDLGCLSIILATRNMSVVKFVRAVGGEARHTLATINLEA